MNHDKLFYRICVSIITKQTTIATKMIRNTYQERSGLSSKKIEKSVLHRMI